jgi:predicted AAA+ superfamily ATPase
MQRQIIHRLLAWKKDPDRKPLILMGARQVGKTYILNAFGKAEFNQVIYLNFEDEPRFCRLFEGSLDPKVILKALSIEFGTKINPEETLIIFDEVQECPNALNSLKYFCEKAREYCIAAAGSLLGVTLSHTKGFPVGKVDFLELYPLSFFEFLEAIDEHDLKQYLCELIQANPLPENLHEKLHLYFKTYLFIGGMPEVVASFSKERDYQKVRDLQKMILNAYRLDFAKHAPAKQLMKINQVWGSIPSQLGKENKKFIYSVLRHGARAREFELALQWLMEAGLIHKVKNVSTPKIPLEAYADPHIFKIYMVDVGLLGAMSQIPVKAILETSQLFQEFRGALVENYTVQTLACCGLNLNYWTSEGKAELDFLLQYETTILPLEIKSGTSHKNKSLIIYDGKYNPPVLIRGSIMNLRHDGKILNCPLYLLQRLIEFLDALKI